MVVLAALQQEAGEGGGSGAASIAQERGLRHASVSEHIARVHTGTMVHCTTCSGCGTRRARAEPYTTLLLPVRGHADLHATLAALVAPEELKGDNAYACDTCGGKREAARAVRLQGGEGLPESLTLHLNRHEYNALTGRRQKVDDAMRFHETLDLAPYLEDAGSAAPAAPALYDLCGVLLHTGGAGGGHYFSYLLTRALAPQEAPRWLSFNDASLAAIAPEDLPRALGTRALGAPTPSGQGAGAGAGASAGSGAPPKPTVHDASSAAYMLLYRKRGSVTAECLDASRQAWSGEALAALLPREVTQEVEAGNAKFQEARAAWERESKRTKARVYYVSAEVRGMLQGGGGGGGGGSGRPCPAPPCRQGEAVCECLRRGWRGPA